jgi:hypothetical protein
MEEQKKPSWGPLAKRFGGEPHPRMLLALDGGIRSGDILFQEFCAELDIPTQLYLAIPPERYVVSSVQKAGERWVERFWKLHGPSA